MLQKIEIDLNDVDNSYIITPGSQEILAIPPQDNIEVQDNYYLITDGDSLPLQQLSPTVGNYDSGSCTVPIIGDTLKFVTYQQMINYVTQGFMNYIIISTIEPQNPPEGQLWIQI